MGRKQVYATEAPAGLVASSANVLMRKKLMNQILYYLRRLLRLARQVSRISEGATPNDLSDVQKQLDDIGEEIRALGNSL